MLHIPSDWQVLKSLWLKLAVSKCFIISVGGEERKDCLSYHPRGQPSHTVSIGVEERKKKTIPKTGDWSFNINFGYS